MTLQYLKDYIRDLGYEDNATMSETEIISIVLNAINETLNYINTDVVLGSKAYFERELSTPEEKWVVPPIQVFTIDTPPETKINLPERVLPLVPLLAAHFVWLDDDITKSTIYYNDYEDMRQRILNSINTTHKVIIKEGLRL